MSKIYFFRHAQASFGAVNYDVLSPKGEQQSLLLGEYLVKKDIKFDKVYSGPLVRQKHTQEIIRQEYIRNNMNFPELNIIHGMKEHLASETLKECLPDILKRYPQLAKWQQEIEEDPTLRRRNGLLSFEFFMTHWGKGNIVVDGIESWKEFRADVKVGLEQILEETGRGETVAVFTSGGTISSVVGESLQMEKEERVATLNLSVRNTSFTSFQYSNDKFNMLAFNELPHLVDEMITFV